MFSAWKGRMATSAGSAGRLNSELKLSGQINMMRHLQPPITLLASWPTDIMKRGHESRASTQEANCSREFYSKSTLMPPRWPLSMAVRATAIKGKFPFYVLRPSAAGPHDSPGSFDLPSRRPVFIGLDSANGTDGEPRPRVTESSGVTADLHCLPSHSVTLVSSQCAPGGDSLRLQLSSISCSPKPTPKKDSPPLSPLSLPRSSPSRKPCKDPMTAGGDEAVTCGKAHLWGGWQYTTGEGRGAEEGEKEKVSSESRRWDFSQLITHKVDSLLTVLCSLIFHLVFFTGPSACPTKVKWREWEYARHTEIYYKRSHSPFMWSQWAREIAIYEDGPEH